LHGTFVGFGCAVSTTPVSHPGTQVTAVIGVLVGSKGKVGTTTFSSSASIAATVSATAFSSSFESSNAIGKLHALTATASITRITKTLLLDIDSSYQFLISIIYAFITLIVYRCNYYAILAVIKSICAVVYFSDLYGTSYFTSVINFSKAQQSVNKIIYHYSREGYSKRVFFGIIVGLLKKEDAH
jgi:hypothetical protein